MNTTRQVGTLRTSAHSFKKRTASADVLRLSKASSIVRLSAMLGWVGTKSLGIYNARQKDWWMDSCELHTPGSCASWRSPEKFRNRTWFLLENIVFPLKILSNQTVTMTKMACGREGWWDVLVKCETSGNSCHRMATIGRLSTGSRSTEKPQKDRSW